MRQTKFIMGMPIVIDIPGAKDETVFKAAFRLLGDIDDQFSTYESGSEVSKFSRGELGQNELSPQLKKIISACRAAEAATEGHFSAWASGKFDPSGYVKGWAISKTEKIIKGMGHKTFCIYAGGDISAQSRSDKIWKIGIQDPNNKKNLLASLSLANMAVATSGNYERGPHIFSPRTKKPADGILSVSVVGLNIIDADVLATAAFVVGEYAVEFVAQRRGFEALVVAKNGRIRMTPGMAHLVD